MRSHISSGHTHRTAEAPRDVTPSRTACRAANRHHSISPRRDAMHLPAHTLGPRLHILVPPHAAHGQLRQRRREILVGRQLRHALSAETPEHLSNLRSTHHWKRHTPKCRQLPTRHMPTRPGACLVSEPTWDNDRQRPGTPGPRWLVASASSGPPSNAGRSSTPPSRSTGPPNSTPAWAHSAAMRHRASTATRRPSGI